MTVSSVGSGSFQPVRGSDSFAKLKKAFEDLGSALQSGNLSDAKEALAQLEKNAPPQAKQANNPISEKLDALSKALDSGDLVAAQNAFADIKSAIAQRPRFAGPGGGAAGGLPPGGAPAGGAKHGSSASESENSNKVYDPKDTNKDGKVSIQEEITYVLEHLGEKPQSSSNSDLAGEQGAIDTFA